MLFSSGNTPETRGTAFVVYEDIFDAKNACDHLSGFNVCNRYLVVLYYQVPILRISVSGKKFSDKFYLHFWTPLHLQTKYLHSYV
jgi:RNA recognition motif-containing protein